MTLTTSERHHSGPDRSHAQVMTTCARMDQLVEEHFRAEVAGDLQAIANGFAADAEHDVAGRPGPPLHGGDQIRAFYDHLLTDLKVERLESVRRWYGQTTSPTNRSCTASRAGDPSDSTAAAAPYTRSAPAQENTNQHLSQMRPSSTQREKD